MRSPQGWAFNPTDPGATGPRHKRPSVPRRNIARVAGTAVTAILASTLVPGAPAFAATPPAAPEAITIFPNRDFVSIDGYQNKIGQLATISVTRAGTLIGRAEGPIAAGSPALEANHPGGVCWGTGAGAPNVTPDILPGDEISVAFNGILADSAVTQSPTVTSFAHTPGSKVILVDGTLTAAGGPAVNLATLGQRIINPSLTATDVGRRDVSAAPGPQVADANASYTSGMTTTPTTFTATYNFNTASSADIAAQGELRSLSAMDVDAAGNLLGLTITEFDSSTGAPVLGGPGIGGCPIGIVTPAAPTSPLIQAASARNASALVTWREQAPGSSAITGYSVKVFDAANLQVGDLRPALAGDTALVVTGLTNGQTYRFQVQATNAVGSSAFSGTSNAVTPATVPGAPLIGTATPANASALARWTAPAGDGGSAVTGYTVRAVNAATLAQIGALRPAAAGTTSLGVTGLANGTAVRFQVRATNALGFGAYSALSTAVTPATVPGAAVIAPANPGLVGGTITARANWTPPRSNGGLAITGYVVTALRMSATGAVLSQKISVVQPATARSLTMVLVAGNYRFTVRARNGLGLGTASARSQLVTAR